MDPLKPPRSDGWPAALAIIERLRAAGHQALLAGGCVRDRLLGLVPKDYDVATSAHPDQVLGLYPRARQVGVKFGVVLVRQGGHDVEVATFRSDGPYSDGRRPDHIEFGTAEQDAHRRDFTINGLFLEPVRGEVIDYVGGQRDLAAGVIRTIGPAALRFSEDHLRMLRAVRFASRLNFKVESTTLENMRTLAGHLASISAERIALELAGILSPPTRLAGWTLLAETNLCHFLVKDWKAESKELLLISARMAALPSEGIAFPLAMAALWASRRPAEARALARSLRCSNREVRTVHWLLNKLAEVKGPSKPGLAGLKRMLADEDWPLLPPLLHADLRAYGAELAPYTELLNQAAAIPREHVAPLPLLSGDDIQAMGVLPGRQLGEVIDLLYTAQLNEEILSKADAEDLVRRWQETGVGKTTE